MSQTVERAVSVHDLGPRTQRPRVALVNAGGHNINARFVLARLAAYLRGLEQGDPSVPGRLRQRVMVVPSGQPEVLPDEVLVQAGQAWHRVVLDTGCRGMDALPQVRLGARPSDDERASACLFGLSSVCEDDDTHTEGHGVPWLAHLDGASGERYMVIAGHGEDLQPALCERLFRALIAFLLRVDAIQGIELADEEDDLHYFGSDQVFRFTSQQPGLFVFRQVPGQWLQAGDLLGYLYDEHDGTLLEELRAPVAGLLASLRRSPLVSEGAVLALIHRR
ncbi:succinylglutamate desuccinylase [Thioalkalivibrio sulfidiphilus]|uniref:succinylglutamate desuccinylase n=1 Tax=Thioalkalivibrio sulfidiphilus TaxID=1033854 RepID=UPI003B39B3FB